MCSSACLQAKYTSLYKIKVCQDEAQCVCLSSARLSPVVSIRVSREKLHGDQVRFIPILITWLTSHLVSGLHSFLHSHGSQQEFSRKDKYSKGLVIDGPALAYNIWRQERLREGDYRQFSKAIEKFLLVLTDTAGFHMYASISVARVLSHGSSRAIYFDGALPGHKRAIRLKRAEANLERVKKNRGSLIHSTPAPPFVVVLAQDVARRLGYPVSVVLEEADTACARKTLELSSHDPCYLLSLDSDLHCFNLGHNGFYLPLDELSCPESSVTGRAYNYFRTQEGLGVDPVHLAAVMGAEGSEEMSRPASEAVRLLKRSNVDKLVSRTELDRVKTQFSTQLPKFATNDLPATRMNLLETGRIYGRFAELFVGKEIWLPQLLEDYTQASSWNVGLRYRAQAYRLLFPDTESPRTSGRVSEWIRRAQCVSGREIDTAEFDAVSIAQPVTVTSVFVECIKTLIQVCALEHKSISQHEYHAFIIMILGSYETQETETTSRVMHLTAQYQATVFSILMLIQAQGSVSWPDFSKLYDFQTFATALGLLRSGKQLHELTQGHEAEVDDLLTRVGWQSQKSSKKAKRAKR